MARKNLKSLIYVSVVNMGVIILSLLINVELTCASGFKFTPEFCEERGLGKYWYCQPLETKEKEITAKDILSSDMPGEQKAAVLNEMWELYRKRAVMDGKQEDIDRFLEVQNVITVQAKLFAQKAQMTVESNPLYAGTNSTYKSQTDWQIEDAEMDHYLKSGAKRYTVVMVYDPKCPSCIRQVSILQELKAKWGFANLGVSLGDEFLGGLDANVSDQAIAKDKAIQGLPTLLLMDNEERIFLSKGLTTTEEVEKLAVQIIKGRNE